MLMAYQKKDSASLAKLLENFPGGTSNTMVENLNRLLKENPDDLIIHVGTNDLTNNVKLLNNVKKIVEQVSSEAT